VRSSLCESATAQRDCDRGQLCFVLFSFVFAGFQSRSGRQGGCRFVLSSPWRLVDFCEELVTANERERGIETEEDIARRSETKIDT